MSAQRLAIEGAMTTTVRILGLRAREQVPGTSITVRAPGLRGELTQLAAGKVPDGMPEPPFAESAPGADVMLAAQLFMDLEARPPDDGPGLRSRSTVAYPRLIVPRRPGVAYALLQTDAGGISSFVFADPGDESEAVFPLTIRHCGATRRTLGLLMWPARQVASPGAHHHRYFAHPQVREKLAAWLGRRPNCRTRPIFGLGARR